MMKIAVSLEEDNGLASLVAMHFGRCPYYGFVDIEDGEITDTQIKKNPFFDSHEPGQVPQFIAQEKADVMIAGGMGGRAIDWFNQLGVTAVTGASGILDEVIKSYLAGASFSGKSPCEEGGHGDQGDCGKHGH